MKHSFDLALFCLAVCLLTGCKSEGGYYPSGQPGLRFSADTVRFDTVFSTVGTTTAWLSVYNPQTRTVLIDSVYLRSQGTSGYRISVDALPGNGCSNLEIPSGDSVFVFIELTARKQNVPTPVILLDDIVFRQGTASQTVTLKASVQDAVIWKGKVLDTDTILTADLPYIIYDSLVVKEGAILELSAGTVLHFHDGAMLKAHGTIKSSGTLQYPVVFRGDRLDKAFTNFRYDSYPGQWQGIYLAPESSGNIFTHSDIHGAYYGIVADSACNSSACKLKIYDSKVTNMVYSSLYSIASDVEVYGSLLANSGSYTVVLIGGAARMVHCTIANYQSIVSREESSPSLVILNSTGGTDGNYTTLYPVRQADIINTVIYGSQKNELGLGLDSQAARNVHFRNVLLRYEGTLADSMAINMYYNEDPLFKSTGKDYVYDFHIDSLSPAANRADTICTELCPYDLDGLQRTIDGHSDLGAYRRPL